MSLIAVAADIHGNVPAFKAVIESALSCDVWWLAGDVVGYGASPVECVRLASRLGATGAGGTAVAGNHDLGSIGAIDLTWFNTSARQACLWTGEQLDEDSRKYITAMPFTSSPAGGVLLVHGSPRDPVWEYLVSPEVALECFRAADQNLCFIGHTHAPLVFTEKAGVVTSEVPGDGDVIRVEDDSRYIINVGSVGQPRDGDPRACFAVMDDVARTVTFKRVPYPVEQAGALIVAAGLPVALASRLEGGL